MDPDVVMGLLLLARENNDLDEAKVHYDALAAWKAKGGFAPSAGWPEGL